MIKGEEERERERERVGRGDNNFNAVAMYINYMIVDSGLVFLVTFQESGVQWFHSLAALKHFVLSLSHALAGLAPHSHGTTLHSTPRHVRVEFAYLRTCIL